jgi:hypothetical protein
MTNTFPSPKELDAQSHVVILKWVELDSDEWSSLDEDPALTKRLVRLGMQEPAYLFCDFSGRVWGRGENGTFYPLHFENGKNLIGIRISKMAVN